MSSLEIYWGNNKLCDLNYKCIPKNIASIDISNWPIVKDRVRCYIKNYIHDNENSFLMMPFNEKYTQYRKIALIVESPHKNEFDNNFNPLVPLNGISGKKFDLRIIDKMNEWFSNISLEPETLFEIKIINPVQYQTSLFHLLNNKIPYHKVCNCKKYGMNRYLRNKLWRRLFEETITKCKADFIHRVISYSPDYIVNCCTSFDKKITLQTTFINLSSVNIVKNTVLKYNVRNALLDNKIKTPYIEDEHPCSW